MEHTLAVDKKGLAGQSQQESGMNGKINNRLNYSIKWVTRLNSYWIGI